jgi:RNA polymerase sigma-70 factor (ECF subfamily)
MGTERFDEVAVWASARDGDADAFADLFDLHRDRVFRHALRLVRSQHDAEDITAAVFLELWRKRDAVRVVEGSVIAWLLVTTNNVARNVSRSRTRHQALIDRLPRGTDHGDAALDAVDARIDSEQRNTKVRSALARLSVADQNVITLCVVEELGTAEAAAALGIPIGTVKSRLSRAKARLAQLAGDALADQSTTGGAI